MVLHGVSHAQAFNNEGEANNGDANADFTDTTSGGDNIDVLNTINDRSEPDQVNEESSVDNNNGDTANDIDTSVIDDIEDFGLATLFFA